MNMIANKYDFNLSAGRFSKPTIGGRKTTAAAIEVPTATPAAEKPVTPKVILFFIKLFVCILLTKYISSEYIKYYVQSELNIFYSRIFNTIHRWITNQKTRVLIC